MFGLLSVFLEVMVITTIIYLIFLWVLRDKFVKKYNVNTKHINAFFFVLFLCLLYLKTASFYFTGRGIEYRRIPIDYPIEIKETEIGTYLFSNGDPIETNSRVSEFDIKTFSKSGKSIFFQKQNGSDSVFEYNCYENTLRPKDDSNFVSLKEFDEQYVIYHYLKADVFLILVGFAGSFCLILNSFSRRK